MRHITSIGAYKFTFMLVLLAAESMLLLRLPKRNRFGLRFAMNIGAHLLIAALYPVGANTPLTSSLMFVFFFAMSVVLSKYCYAVTWNACLFCVVAGYSFQP